MNSNILDYRALDSKVLTVAVHRLDAPEAWTAYIGAVPGQSHQREVDQVYERGNKLPENLARVIFPQFEGPYIL